MQDQGKRLLLAVAVALGFLLLWNTFFSKKSDQPTTPGAGSAALAPANVVVPKSRVGCGAGDDTSPEDLTTRRFGKLIATFSSKGAVLKSWQLTDKRYEHDATHGELLATQGAFDVNFDCGSTFNLKNGAQWELVKEQSNDTQVVYHYPPKASGNGPISLTKTFTIIPDAFLVKVTIDGHIDVGDKPGAFEALAVTSYELQDPKTAGGGSSRIQARAWQSSTRRAESGDLVTTPVTSMVPPEGKPRFEPKVQWTGFEHPYILVGFAPNPAAGAVAKQSFADADGLIRTDLIFAKTEFNKGASKLGPYELVGYLGPKNYDALDHADATAGFPTGFKSVIDLGWFAFIGRPLLWLLLKFHELVGNWGLAIVMLTLVVKGATLYWTTKSMRSMKAMAVLGPQMKALQEKHKDDKQRLQVETMALYKQHGVNPLAGCLPIVMQMPIWLALYRMLQSAGELYQQPFISGWVNDLTDRDPYYILPVALVILMFVQARLTPQTVDPSQRVQQRMMQYGMPLMFGIFCFFCPSGLTLYILTNTCLSALHSIYMNKYDKKSIALAIQLKKNREVASAAKDAEAAKQAKDANAKNDEASDDDAAAPAAEEKPRARANQSRRKKGGRR